MKKKPERQLRFHLFYRQDHLDLQKITQQKREAWIISIIPSLQKVGSCII